jgi:hypothetical protein
MRREIDLRSLFDTEYRIQNTEYRKKKRYYRHGDKRLCGGKRIARVAKSS